jgi:hypothetical protein
MMSMMITCEGKDGNINFKVQNMLHVKTWEVGRKLGHLSTGAAVVVNYSTSACVHGSNGL